MKKYIITGVMAAVAATSAFAGTVTASKEVAPVESPCLFRDNEVQLDLFGLGDFYKGANGNFINNLTGVGGESRQFSGRPGWGGGLGLNYIFAKYFGVGIEQSLFGRNSNPTKLGSSTYDVGNYGYTRWQTTGNLIFRYPICQWNLAPYLLVGGGAQYGNVPNINLTGLGAVNRSYKMAGQGFGHVGGGLEYRVSETIGLFSDARYLFSGVDGLANNQLQWRYGLRFAF